MQRSLQLIQLRLRRSWLVIFIIAGLATGTAAVWWELDVMEISDSEVSAYDEGLKAFTIPKRAALKFLQEHLGLGKVVRSDDVVVVALDDKTLTEVSASAPLSKLYGRSVPFDRVIWANLITYLSKAGARAIVFDMVMNEPSSDGTGEVAFANALEEISAPVILGFNTAPNDTALPKVEANLQRPLGAMPAPPQKVVAEDEFPEPPTAEEQAAMDAAAAKNRLLWAAKAYSVPVNVKELEVPSFPKEIELGLDGNPTGKELPHFPMPSLPQVLESADGFGAVTVEEDDDGKMRRTAFLYTDGNNVYPTLSVVAVARLEQAKEVTLEKGKLTIGSRRVRINNDGTAEIHYGGRLGDRFRMIPMIDVLNRFHFCNARVGKSDKVAFDCPGGDMGKDPEGAPFKGKVVLVGGTHVGSGDSKTTPLEANVPGLVKQAATIENLLNDQFVIAAPYWVSLCLSLLVALFSVSLVLVVRNAFVDIGWPVLLYLGFFTVTGGFLVATRIHILSAMPGLAGTVGSILAILWERLLAPKERERLRTQFQNFMEGDRIDLMVEQQKLPTLEGKLLEVSALCSDIKGFAVLSDHLRGEPLALMRLLNRYLSALTPELTAQGGCLEKYLGGSVTALFGAPMPEANHALQACQGALSAQAAVAELRADLRAQKLPEVFSKVGLNTGTMLVGNIGSEQLLSYTAFGDEMDMAKALSALNDTYDTLIIMGPSTYAAVKDHVESRELDWVRVGGRNGRQMAVHELLALRGELSVDKRRVLELYGQALVAYRAREFNQAKVLAGQALAVDGGDGPSKRLLGLCTQYEKHLPPEEWDGVLELEN